MIENRNEAFSIAGFPNPVAAALPVWAPAAARRGVRVGGTDSGRAVVGTAYTPIQGPSRTGPRIWPRRELRAG